MRIALDEIIVMTCRIVLETAGTYRARDNTRTIGRMKNGLFYWAREAEERGEVEERREERREEREEEERREEGHGERGRRRGTCRESAFLIINTADVRAEGARLPTPRIEWSRVGCRAHQEPLHLQWRHAETDRMEGRTDGRMDERTDGQDGTLIPSYTKYLLKSLISLLLAGVDIPYERGSPLISANDDG